MAAANSGSVGRGKPLWPQGTVDIVDANVRKVVGQKFEPGDPTSAVLSTAIAVHMHLQE
jgi:hypothetical protein